MFLRFAELKGQLCGYSMTSTGLAVVSIEKTADADKVFASLVALIYAFEQNALDLPIAARDGDALDTACLETAALIRGYDRFVADRQVVPTFLPDRALDAVRDFQCAVELADKAALDHPRLRLGALLAASGATMVPPHILGASSRLIRGIDRTLSGVRQLEPVHAADTIRRWVGRTGNAEWIVAENKKARVTRPKVIALGTIVDGVLATDQMNKKGFALTVKHLHEGAALTRRRPFIGREHDRTIPPSLIVIDSHVCCEDEAGTPRHKLRAQIAAIDEEGEAQLRLGGGFSVAFDIQTTRGSDGRV